MIDLQEKLVKKSIEAFILGLEVFNKPTIVYRIEGFSFFICNAWELMLKAELLKRGISIYYKNNPDRTLNLSATIRKIYTDKNTRIRLNLERILELRNLSTHFITEDYEIKYAPLFQACVLNFSHELERFHGEHITNYIAQNFLTLSATYEPLTNEQIRMKYPAEIAEKFIKMANNIDILTEEFNSERFAIGIRQNLYITKKKGEADFSVSIGPDSENKIAIVKQLKDPADTHPFSYNSVLTVIQERIKKQNIPFKYAQGFNSYVLNLIISFYNVKDNEDYAYQHVIGKNAHYTYSQSFINFILDIIKKDPVNFVASLKKSKKKITPGT